MEKRVLRQKGALLVLCLLASSDDSLRQTTIRDRTGLSNGTTQRRLDDLADAGWIQRTAAIRENRACKLYRLSDDAARLQDPLAALASAVL